MKAMLDDVEHRIEGGAIMSKRTIPITGKGEGDVGGPLAKIAENFPDVSIGSYPYFDGNGYGLNIVIRAYEDSDLDKVEAAIRETLNL